MSWAESNETNTSFSQRGSAGAEPARERVYWRVEGSLLNLTAVRPVGFFTWNAQTFCERWARRGGMVFLALVRPFLYCTNRVFATRVLHALLRGVSRDRLDLLGEEYFEYVLKPQLKRAGRGTAAAGDGGGRRGGAGEPGLDHVMRPLAQHLGVRSTRLQPAGISRRHRPPAGCSIR